MARRADEGACVICLETSPPPIQSGCAAFASNLANSLIDQGKYAEAEDMQHEVLRVYTRLLRREHPSTVMSAHNLASCFFVKKKFEQAESMMHAPLVVCTAIMCKFEG